MVSRNVLAIVKNCNLRQLSILFSAQLYLISLTSLCPSNHLPISLFQVVLLGFAVTARTGTHSNFKTSATKNLFAVNIQHQTFNPDLRDCQDSQKKKTGERDSLECLQG